MRARDSTGAPPCVFSPHLISSSSLERVGCFPSPRFNYVSIWKYTIFTVNHLKRNTQCTVKDFHLHISWPFLERATAAGPLSMCIRIVFGLVAIVARAETLAWHWPSFTVITLFSVDGASPPSLANKHQLYVSITANAIQTF